MFQSPCDGALTYPEFPQHGTKVVLVELLNIWKKSVNILHPEPADRRVVIGVTSFTLRVLVWMIKCEEDIGAFLCLAVGSYVHA